MEKGGEEAFRQKGQPVPRPGGKEMALLRNLRLAGGGQNAGWGAEEVGGKETQGPHMAGRTHSTLSASPFPPLPVQPQDTSRGRVQAWFDKGEGYFTSPHLRSGHAGRVNDSGNAYSEHSQTPTACRGWVRTHSAWSTSPESRSHGCVL